jgi:hypothetical protein
MMTSNGDERKRNNTGRPDEKGKKAYDPNRRNDRRTGKDSYRGANKSRGNGSSEYGSYSKKSSFRTADIKVEETAEDIRTDITRIEKEIRLMMDEIRSMKL